jgi:hypothetical protein
MFTMIFKCFLSVFASVTDTCFKCFICLILYVASIVSECFKVDWGVAHGMRLGSERGRERSPCVVGQHGPAAGALARKSDSIGALARSLREHRPMLASRIGRPDASKSKHVTVLIEQIISY